MNYQPELNKNNFICPHCGVVSNQDWNSLYSNFGTDFKVSYLRLAYCQNPDCREYSLWRNDKMIFPMKLTAPLAHTDMPSSVKVLYDEARNVATLSPRAAAALLRVSLEKLTEHLGEDKGDLNARIASLSKRGLPQKVIKSLDIVRITANEGGSHAGEIDLTGKDNTKIVDKLFWLVNFIVEKTIYEPNIVDEMFDSLPEGKKQGISDRDKEK
jgi:hypothetical protein